jgi:tetratricopeptide (TPR) repeat protein
MARKRIGPVGGPSAAAQPAAPAAGSPRLRPALLAGICLALAVSTVAVYAQTRGHGFIDFDDNCYVYDNPVVTKGLSAAGAAWAFTTFSAANWHPVTWLSHMLDVSLFGLDPGAHHVMSLAIHVATTLILFAAFTAMTARPWRSAVVAGVFALHPLHVESVAWVAERKDVLSAFWAAVALLCYARYARRRTFRRYLLVALALALGLMSKPMLVTLPFVLLLLDVWPLGRLSWPPDLAKLTNLVVEKIPLFAMVAASSALTFAAQRRGGAVWSLTRLPLPDRLATAVVAYARYVVKSFWPLNLGVLYPYEDHPPLLVFAVLAGLAAVTAATVVAARRRPYLMVGWLWFLGMLVPVIGLVQVGSQSMADRYMYLPLVGLSAAVAWGAADLAAGSVLSRRAAAAVACAALAAFAFLAYRQAGYWTSSLPLFEHTLAVTGPNYVIHKNIGVELEHAGRTAEAIDEYAKALAINPRYAEAHNAMGVALVKEGRHEEAVAHYEKALKSQPAFTEALVNMGAALESLGRREEAAQCYRRALSGRGDAILAHQNLGLLAAREGRSGEAKAHYAQVLALDPDHAEAHSNLGVILAAEGRTEEAVSHFRKAVASQPDNAEAHANLGHELLKALKVDEARSHLARALDLKSSLFEAHADLGTLYAAEGKFADAARHLDESLRLSPGQPNVHNNLGFVLVRLGKFEEARVHAVEAVRLDLASADAHYNLGTALAGLGRPTEAAAEFSRALSLNPSHASARAQLERLQQK